MGGGTLTGLQDAETTTEARPMRHTRRLEGASPLLTVAT